MTTTSSNTTSSNTTSSNTKQQPHSDILDPTWWQSNPQADFDSLLAHPGLWQDEHSGIFIAARHADLLAVERDAETFSSHGEEDGGMYRLEPSPGELTMISADDPRHLEQRRAVNRRFTPRAVRSHADHYSALVKELVDDALAENTQQGAVEVVDSMAAKLPCMVTAEFIGFGRDMWREVKSWSERQMRIDRRTVDPQAFNDLNDSIHEWAEVMQEVLPQRFEEPAEDMFSDWLAAGFDGNTMVMETGLLIAGGAETTRTVIAHGLRTFVDHPDDWEFLAQNPDAIPTAMEEMIRWVTPLNNMFRRVTRHTEVAGTTLNDGDRVMLLYPAANHDPLMFDDPHTFDIRRDPNPHLSFGHGTHFCLGANLARIELRLLFEELTQRVTNLRVVNEPDIEPNIFARAVRSFDLTFDLR